MIEYVYLDYKRSRGWSWPEVEGLTSMFGEDNWCRACGLPRGEQAGSMVLERKGMKVSGAWVPHAPISTICAEQAVGEEIRDKFGVEIRQLGWHASSPGDAVQLMIPTIGDSWFDPEELRVAAIESHGDAGATCADCGVWRWMPPEIESRPTIRIESGLGGVAIAQSPEWLGSGWQALHEIVVRRDLAEFLAEASPKDFAKTWASGPCVYSEQGSPAEVPLCDSTPEVRLGSTGVASQDGRGLEELSRSEIGSAQGGSLDTQPLHVGTADRARTVFPLVITRANLPDTYTYLFGGLGWCFTVDCNLSVHFPKPDGGVESVPGGEFDIERLVGETIVGLEAPDDMYDPVFICESGVRIEVEDNEYPYPWVFEVDGKFKIEGPTAEDHDDWEQGNIGDEPE